MNTKSQPASAIPNPVPRRAARPLRAGRMTALVLAILASAGYAFGATEIPDKINYQGKLTDQLGKEVASGNYEVQFKIWNVSSGGTAADYIWGRSFTVHVVTNGMFNVLLDDAGGGVVGSPRTNSLLYAFDGPDRYLGLTITKFNNSAVANQAEISPRQRLVSAPFAFHAQNAASASTASNATTAGSAAFASYANFATNASKLGSFTTNDFVLLKKSSQTIDGGVTITNGDLALKKGLSVSSTVTASGDLTVGGKLGIGTTAPLYPLTFASVLGDKIDLWGSAAGNHYGFGIQGSLLQVHSDSSASDIAFGYGQSTNFTETMRIKNSGRVGIGTTGPTHELDVQSPGDTEIGIKSTDANGHLWSLQSSGMTNSNSNLNGSFQIIDRTAGASRLMITTNGSMLVNSQAPFQIRRYSLPNMKYNHTSAQAFRCTNYTSADWSAAVVGVHVKADIEESHGDRFIEFRMTRGSPDWTLYFDVHSDNDDSDYDVQGIYVDVMFIRKELCYDPDR